MSQLSAPSERLLYPNLTTINEQYINDKILANNKFNNNINIIKYILEINMKLKLVTIIRR